MSKINKIQKWTADLNKKKERLELYYQMEEKF